jgi:hypothetical protein
MENKQNTEGPNFGSGNSGTEGGGKFKKYKFPALLWIMAVVIIVLVIKNYS